MSELHETVGKDLDDLLEQWLHPDDYKSYRKMHDYHFWEWKTHRICDQGSLRGLRALLYHSRAVTIAREPTVERDRPFHEYATELGFNLDWREERDPFSGLGECALPQQRDFSEPGDCLELYESPKAGLADARFWGEFVLFARVYPGELPVGGTSRRSRGLCQPISVSYFLRNAEAARDLVGGRFRVSNARA